MFSFLRGGIFLSNPFMCKVKTKTEKYFFFCQRQPLGYKNARALWEINPYLCTTGRAAE